MLEVQFSDGRSAFGAILASPAIADLQRYLVSLGKLNQSSVTGAMNDATMTQIYNLFIASTQIVSKISLLPVAVRDGVNKVVNALKSIDSLIRSTSFGKATLQTVINNWVTINAAVRIISASAADTLAKAREDAYNAVGSNASIIRQALMMLFPVPSTGTVPGFPITPGAGTVGDKIYAYSVKRGGMYRVAIMQSPGKYIEIAPSSTPPAGFGDALAAAQQVTEPEFEKLTGQAFFSVKNPLFWVAVAGGVIVVGGGGYLLFRRKRSIPHA